MNGGIKTLGLHLPAPCRNVVLLIFGRIGFRSSYYRAVSAFQENILFVFSEPIEVKVSLLFENVLTRCTVTRRKCFQIT